ncbi:MAG TPA: sensor histidine kinase [Beutenbergiaceae bacterium]|nr:sensor histidine kinase [Beutenbergiaceae bacterium]
MTAPDAGSRRAARTDWVWLALPYATLAASSMHAWLGEQISPGDVSRTIAASVAFLLWHTWWTVGHRQWLERALVPMAIYYLGLIALSTVLLQTSFSYFVFYLASYPMAFVALPGRWAYAGLGLAAITPLAIPTSLDWSRPSIFITLGGLVFAGFIGSSIRKLETETAARKAALTDLGQAHADLERALAENISLQHQLVAEARESGVAAERARLGAEIHDTLAAALAGIISQLEALDAELAPTDPIRSRVQASTGLARESLREARHSIRALRAAPLVHQHLPLALAELTESFEGSTNLPARLHVTGAAMDLPEDVEHALLRIAQEALTNASRHAGADQVHLTLSYLGDAVALDVADDGAGFEHRGSPRGGHGLEIMTQRARALSGRVDFRTEPGSGTTVTATVPLPAPDVRQSGGEA